MPQEFYSFANLLLIFLPIVNFCVEKYCQKVFFCSIFRMVFTFIIFTNQTMQMLIRCIWSKHLLGKRTPLFPNEIVWNVILCFDQIWQHLQLQTCASHQDCRKNTQKLPKILLLSRWHKIINTCNPRFTFYNS